ncbi:MAG: hypothetical protein AVDCRST_MAG64-1945 [uncultured Phycisphaerae bacterium]|uniref:Uncharacterized protein n=1 Tax=uncultured Phycisphaerae bacterium TaxID=904963 RepID=A0A6J4P3N3_9BACT|nr:MAG: hypothetical protein AVDCRST_MAG64-1945 [uncultured Phycisphaerae bacterium]
MARNGSVAIAAATATTATAAVPTAAAAATATVAAAAATAAAATVPAAAAATRAVLTRLGHVDGQVAAVDVLAVQGVDRGLGLLVGAHLDEAEALAAAGVPVADDLCALHRTVLREELLEIRAGRVVAQVPDVQLAVAHWRFSCRWARGPRVYFPGPMRKRPQSGPGR